MTTEDDVPEIITPELQKEIDSKKSKLPGGGAKKLSEKEVDRILKSMLPPGMTNADYCKAPGPDGKSCDYPLWNGECRKCEDDKQKMRELESKYRTAIGGAKAWREYTESGFQFTDLNVAAFAFAKQFDYRQHSLFLFSLKTSRSEGTGTGKSRLAAIAKRRWILQDVACRTLILDEFYMEMRANIKDARRQREVIQQLVRIPILGIEDLGVEKRTEFAENVLYQVVEGRARDRRQGLVITSNLSLPMLRERVGPRTVSRLYEMCKVFDLTGERDWRTAK